MQPLISFIIDRVQRVKFSVLNYWVRVKMSPDHLCATFKFHTLKVKTSVNRPIICFGSVRLDVSTYVFFLNVG